MTWKQRVPGGVSGKAFCPNEEGQIQHETPSVGLRNDKSCPGLSRGRRDSRKNYGKHENPGPRVGEFPEHGTAARERHD